MTSAYEVGNAVKSGVDWRKFTDGGRPLLPSRRRTWATAR